MSTVPARRHALGLPAGSIRAAHVLMIVGLVCAIVVVPSLIPSVKPMPVPPYLLYLLFIVFFHFFASHSAASGASQSGGHLPMYLPVGLVRFLLVAALAGSIGWMLCHDEEGLRKLFDDSVDGLKTQRLLPVILFGAFFLGLLVRAIVGREFPPVALQDLEAWLSLLGLVGLGIAVVYHLVIAPTVDNRPDMYAWEGFLAAVIAFYFGERS